MNKSFLIKYASLAVNIGVNIQKDNILVISSPIETAEFARLITEEAYKSGAKDVIVHYGDQKLTKIKLENSSLETISNIPEWQAESYNYYARQEACFISISASDPDGLKGVPVEKIGASQKARTSALKEYFDNSMSNKCRWCVLSVPTLSWAKKVFPKVSDDEAMESLWDVIFKTVRVDTENPVNAWKKHNAHLEEKFGVGFHTISVPRLQPANGVSLENYPHLLDDKMFKKIVAILRIAVPFTGLILSTRETPEMRKELLKYGVSQISAGSSTGVGGYKEREEGKEVKQFKTNDERSPIEILKELLSDGYIPSYCTACYRKGRTGDRFMSLAKSGNIKYVCEPNALMTLLEFTLDYGDEELYKKSLEIIDKEVENIEREDIKSLTKESMEKMKKGQRDFYL